MTEFQRLKSQEQKALEWSAKRELAKVNYRIHTDAIKENIVPTLTEEQLKYVYADEADLLNVALFGKTAAQWRKENPTLKGNIRDYATIEQLLVIANMESYAREIRCNVAVWRRYSHCDHRHREQGIYSCYKSCGGYRSRLPACHKLQHGGKKIRARQGIIPQNPDLHHCDRPGFDFAVRACSARRCGNVRFADQCRS